MFDEGAEVVPFPTREGMGDRSGMSRQTRRAESRQIDKKKVQLLKQMERDAPQIFNAAELNEEQKIETFQQFLRYHEGVTRGELQEVIMSTLTMYDKMASEVRRLLISNQALLRLLVTSGQVDEEEYKTQARIQIEWNSFVNNIVKAYGEVPLRDLVTQVRDWNANPENILKVDAHHIDLAKHLLDDEGMTLEEKLLLAQEMELPENFLSALRNKEYQKYDPPSLLADAQTLSSDVPADEDPS
jgi:hypothetical protein